MEEKKRGGAREGSGRKKMDEKEKKKTVSYVLSPDLIEFIKEHGGSKFVEKILREEKNKNK